MSSLYETLFRSAFPPRTSRVPRFFRAPPRIPTPADVDAVLRVTDNDDRARDHLLVAVAAGTGIRVHELLALDWAQLLAAAGAVRHRVHLRAEDTKGNVGGDVVLNEALRWKVTRYRTWCVRRGHVYKATKNRRLTQVAMRHRSASSAELYTHVGERDVEAAVERPG